MKAAVLTKYGHFEWKDVPDPEIRENEVLTRIFCADEEVICTYSMAILNRAPSCR